jgi:potassium-dependent mechanosensitive channel
MPASFSDLSSGDLINCVRATIHGVIVAVIALAAFASRAAGAPSPSAPAGLQPTGLAQATQQAQSVLLPIAPIPIPEIAQRAEQVAILLRIAEHSPEDAEVQEIESQLAAADDWIGRRVVGTTQTLGSLPSASALANLTDLWRVMRSRLVAWSDTLTTRATRLEQQVEQIERMRATWSATREAAAQATAPASVVDRVDATLRGISAARTRAGGRLAHALGLQDRVVNQIARCDDVLARIAAASDEQAGPLLSRDGLPIWSHEAGALIPANAQQRLLESLVDMVDLSRGFVVRRLMSVLLQVVLLATVFLLARRARAAARRQADKGPSERAAAQVFELPLSSAIVVALLATPWIYPEAPRLMSNVVGLLVLVPALRIVRRLASPAIAPAVYALAAFFLVDRAREVCSALPVLEQRVFLLEMVAGIAFLALTVRSERFLTNDETVIALAGRRGVVWVLWAQLSVFGVAVVASALGYMRLARLLGGEVLASSYIALVLYAGVRVGQGLLVYLLRAWPVRRLFMVQHHGALLQRRGSQALRWLAVGTWAYFSLDALGLTSRIWSAGTVVLEARYVRGSFSLSLGDVAVFVLTIGAAFALASVVRFILQEDVYPRIWLPRGVSYAVSTLIRYGIILAGFVVAILVLGVNLDRVTLVAGALGVGIGIGLQNAVANFVSGLILLLERRIHVGDSIQIGDLQGEVRQIGSRASTIRTWDGAEVIVPNAGLTSERVTNWTLSDRTRRVTLPVRVVYTAAPELVMAILRDMAKAHPKALADPSPVALCTGFGENGLNFEVRVWTARTEDAESLLSQLAVDVHGALTAAKIEMAFPQREVHIRNVDDRFPIVSPSSGLTS